MIGTKIENQLQAFPCSFFAPTNYRHFSQDHQQVDFFLPQANIRAPYSVMQLNYFCCAAVFWRKSRSLRRQPRLPCPHLLQATLRTPSRRGLRFVTQAPRTFLPPHSK